MVTNASVNEEKTALPRLLTLEVAESADRVELKVTSDGSRSSAVEFSLEVSGTSTSRHRGKTTVSAGSGQTLATVRVNKSRNWCAVLEVSEEGGESYTDRHGACG